MTAHCIRRMVPVGNGPFFCISLKVLLYPGNLCACSIKQAGGAAIFFSIGVQCQEVNIPDIVGIISFIPGSHATAFSIGGQCKDVEVRNIVACLV